MKKNWNLNLKHCTFVAMMFLSFTLGFAQQNKLDIHAHRGGAGLYPENSVVAMLNSVAMGVRVLELDVHVTADNVVVVSHDPYFTPKKALAPGGVRIDQGTKMQHAIYQMRYEDVRKYDVGLIPQKNFPTRQNVGVSVPLLSQVIDEVEKYTKKFNLPPVYYNIEIKSAPIKDNRLAPRFDRFSELCMQVIQDKGIKNRTIIQSFDVRTLEYMHKFYPEVVLSYLVNKSGRFEKDLNKLSFVPEIYSPHYKKVSQKMVDKAHRWGMKVIPWTVNKRSNLTYMLQVGVDAIITDYPNRMQKWLKELEPKY